MLDRPVLIARRQAPPTPGTSHRSAAIAQLAGARTEEPRLVAGEPGDRGQLATEPHHLARPTVELLDLVRARGGCTHHSSFPGQMFEAMGRGRSVQHVRLVTRRAVPTASRSTTVAENDPVTAPVQSNGSGGGLEYLGGQERGSFTFHDLPDRRLLVERGSPSEGGRYRVYLEAQPVPNTGSRPSARLLAPPDWRWIVAPCAWRHKLDGDRLAIRLHY
jgi:hypothetical protein